MLGRACRGLIPPGKFSFMTCPYGFSPRSEEAMIHFLRGCRAWRTPHVHGRSGERWTTRHRPELAYADGSLASMPDRLEGSPRPRLARRTRGTHWEVVHVRDDHGRGTPACRRRRCQPLGRPRRPLPQPAARRAGRDSPARRGARRHGGSAPERRGTAVDRRRLSPHLRRTADPLRHPRRPDRPPQSAPARLRDLRHRVRRRRLRRHPGHTHRRTRPAGCRRCDDHARDALDTPCRLPRPAGTGDGDRHMDRGRRGRRRHRTGPRRLPRRALLVGLGLPDQHPADGADPAHRPAAAAGVPGNSDGPWTCWAPCSPPPACSASSSA